MSNRDSIFISHVNPEDNYFATWLATKLALLGYKVWVDKKAIKHGSYFTLEYEKEIRENTILFLAVTTSNYLQKMQIQDTGIYNELSLARTFRDEIIKVPLILEDNLENNLPSGLINRDACFFNNNWGKGLSDLIEFFTDKSICKHEVLTNALSLWYEAQKIKTEPIEKEEKYLTNWFEVELPSKVRIFKGQIITTYFEHLKTSEIIFIDYANYIITFSSLSVVSKYMKIIDEYEFNTKDFIEQDNICIHKELELIETKKIFARLMNNVLKVFMFRQHLRKYENVSKTSRKKNIFHFPYDENNKKMVSLKLFEKGSRTIIGKTDEFYWYYGISFRFALTPFIGYKINYYLVFTDKNSNYLNKDEQHALRRSLPSSWFNRKWLEMLLAFIHKISNYSPDKIVKIFYDDENYLLMNKLPLSIKSIVGYSEPGLENEN